MDVFLERLADEAARDFEEVFRDRVSVRLEVGPLSPAELKLIAQETYDELLAEKLGRAIVVEKHDHAEIFISFDG